MLLVKFDYRDFGIIGEPYFDIDFSDVLYLTDTGRRWDNDKFSVRDKVATGQRDRETKRRRDFGTMIDDCRLTNLGTINDDRRSRQRADKLTSEKNKTMNEKLGMRFRGTQDIIDAAEAGLLPDKIMITVHPQRWSASFLPWTRELVWQNFKNLIKKAVVLRSQRADFRNQ